MKSSDNPCDSPKEHLSADLASLVRHYIKVHRPRSEYELEYFKKMLFPSALEKASLAINAQGKRFSHQRRLTSESLNESKKRLSKTTIQLKDCRTFAELYDLVEGILHEVYGVNELYYYDTALHLGASLGICPEVVYLHRGTRDGAKALGLDWRSKTLDPKIFPHPIRKLRPHEIEDFLCIYKGHLKGKSNGQI